MCVGCCSLLPQGVTSMYLEIYDECSFTMDELIAWAQISIPQAVIAAGETHDEWYPLNGKQGDGQEGMVNLVFSYTVSIMRPLADLRQGQCTDLRHKVIYFTCTTTYLKLHPIFSSQFYLLRYNFHTIVFLSFKFFLVLSPWCVFYFYPPSIIFFYMELGILKRFQVLNKR